MISGLQSIKKKEHLDPDTKQIWKKNADRYTLGCEGGANAKVDIENFSSNEPKKLQVEQIDAKLSEHLVSEAPTELRFF